MAVARPIGVLRYRFRSTTPDADWSFRRWSDSAFDAVFNPNTSQGWGLAAYWQECSLGEFDLSATHVFPWQQLDMDQPLIGGRSEVAAAALQQARDRHGVDLSRFAAFVVWVEPPPINAGATEVDVDGRIVGVAVLDQNAPHSDHAHEIGHTLLTKDHSWGIVTTQNNVASPEYGDPYCIMSARTFGGRDPTFPLLPILEPGIESAAGRFWSGAGPGPAAATLHRYLPSQPQPRSWVKILPTIPQSGVAVTIHDLAGARTDRTLLVVTPDLGTGNLYAVEYRAGRLGWDQGLRDRVNDPDQRGAPGVVIHTYRGAPGEQKVWYEGTIPVPLRGDRDWWVPALGIRVDDVAADESWVHVTLGGPQLGKTMGVKFAGIVTIVDDRAGVEDRETFGDEWLCVRGTYRYRVHEIDERLECTAQASGFELPIFAWVVNGVALPPHRAGMPTGLGQITVPVAVTVPDTKGPASEGSSSALLGYTLSENQLILTTAPTHGAAGFPAGQDGRYAVDVSVRVEEASSEVVKVPGQRSDATDRFWFTGFDIKFEQRFYDDVERCMNNLRERAESKVRQRAKEIDKGRPWLWRNPHDAMVAAHVAGLVSALPSEDAPLKDQLVRTTAMRFRLAATELRW